MTHAYNKISTGEFKGKYPGFEELIINLQKTRQLDSDLQHRTCDKSHIPVESADFLLQKLYKELCDHNTHHSLLTRYNHHVRTWGKS